MTDVISLKFLFANVLIEQMGLPVPSTPALILGGAAIHQGFLPIQIVLPMAFLATFIPNLIWFLAGRRYGNKMMGLVCKMSFTPESCVRDTTSTFSRWGIFALLVSKFIPGLSTLAAPLSGAMKISVIKFLVFNSLGSLIWLAVSMGVGYFFHEEVNKILTLMKEIGAVAFPLIALVLGGIVFYKWWRRRRFLNGIKMERITVDELKEIQKSETPVIIYEIRNQPGGNEDLIPGAQILSFEDIDRGKKLVGYDHEIITYCHCPEEASAALAAKKLKLLGYTKVRPLKGGAEAWFKN